MIALQNAGFKRFIPWTKVPIRMTPPNLIPSVFLPSSKKCTYNILTKLMAKHPQIGMNISYNKKILNVGLRSAWQINGL
jgi:hypothetical protein